MGRYAALDPVKDEVTGKITLRVPKLRLRMLLAEKLGDIQAATGRQPDPEQICWLYELCKENLFPRADSPPSFLVPPVVLGAGTKNALALYEPTVMALAWLEEYAARWWSPTRDLAPAAFAYAHSGGDESAHEIFAALTNRRTAVCRVNKWYRGLPFSPAQLRWAVEEISGFHRDGHVTLDLPPNCWSRDESATALDWGEIVATLAATFQQPPSLFANMNESQAIDLWQSSDKTPLAGMLGGGKHSDRSEGGAKALLALNAAVRHIIAEMQRPAEDSAHE